MKFSERQLAVINADGADVLVSASAGSGKTTVMIERVLRLIAQGAQLKRMVICTFTRAAAADMREKLLTALTARANQPNCLNALKQLPQAEICTLHSFCVKLARAYFYAIELEPSFEILGDGDGALLCSCLDEVIDSASGDDFERLYEIMLSSRKDKAFRKALLKLYSFAAAMPRPREWLYGCLDGYDDETKALSVIESDYLCRRQRLLALCEQLEVKTKAAGFTRNIAAVQSLTAALTGGDKSFLVSPARTRVPPETAQLNEDFKELRDAVISLLDRREEIDGLASSAGARFCGEVLVNLALKLSDTYGREKRKKGVADYNDLEHFAYEILSSVYGQQIRDSYDYIFVDEYQDINPLQNAVIELLKRENNLFMVGDLKQSIYAFRGCDPSIFARKRDAFASGEGIGIELNLNFRTAPPIIDCVNRVFSHCMTRDLGGVDYEREAQLKAGLESGGGKRFRYVNVVSERRPPVKKEGVYRLSRHEWEEQDDENSEQAESDFIVSEIMRLLSEGGADGETVSPADIAVLTRSESRLVYAVKDKLNALGVPVGLSGKSPYCELEETAPLIAVLRLCDNPDDDVALACALLSYTGNLTDDDLAAAASSAAEDEPFYETAKRSPAAESFYQRLSVYQQLKQSQSAAELLSLIAAETDAFTNVLKMTEGESRSRNLSALLALAASRGSESVSDFLEFLDAGEGAENSASDDSLKIMSIHKSKGLEFPYVFVAGVKKQFNKSDLRFPMLCDEKWGLAFKYPDETERRFKPTFLTEAASIEFSKRALEEEMRILYVAMTRAKRALTVSGCNIKPRSELKRGEPPACQADFLEALTPETVYAENVRISETPPPYVPVFAGGDAETAARIKERFDFLYPYEGKAAKSSVTASARYEWESEGYDYGRPVQGEDGGDAAERGTAYHTLLQALDFSRPVKEQWRDLTARFKTAVDLVDLDVLERAHDAVGKLTEGCKLYREKEFIIDEQGTLLQGVIDLLAVRGDSAVIIDYKTGKTPDKPQYLRQLELYADSVSRLLDLKVTAKYVYALDLGRLIKM